MVTIDPIRVDEGRNMRGRIEDLRALYPLSAMVERHTPVRRHAQGGIACCPFHDDRNPSFSIFANDTRFHCHGCGVSGDVIAFVQRMHGVGFSEALAMLIDGTIPAPDPVAFEPRDNVDRIREARDLFAKAAPAEGIFCDLKQNRDRTRLPTLKRVLNNANRTSVIADVQSLPSPEVVLLQLCDVLLGAASARINDRKDLGDAKESVVAHLERRLNRKCLGATPKYEEKFNIFRIQLGGGW